MPVPAATPARLHNRHAVPVRLGMALVLCTAVGGCLGAAGRDTSRDREVQAQFDQRRMEHSRLKQSLIDESSDAGINAGALPTDPDTSPGSGTGTGTTASGERLGAPLLGQGQPQHSTYFYWVTDMATADPLSGLTRRSELLAAGRPGFSACLTWLASLRLAQLPPTAALSTGEPTSQSALPGVLHVIGTVHAMLENPDAFGITRADEALIAATVAPWTRCSWDALRIEAFSVVARCYTAEEAPVLGLALTQEPRSIATGAAEALCVHTAPLKRIDPAWNPAAAATSLGLRVEVSGTSGQLRVVGAVSIAAEQELAAISTDPAWRAAVADVAARSRAALSAVSAVWSLLGDSDPATRALAAQTLRRLTLYESSPPSLRQAVAQYRPMASPLTRTESQLRWAAELLADPDLGMNPGDQ